MRTQSAFTSSIRSSATALVCLLALGTALGCGSSGDDEETTRDDSQQLPNDDSAPTPGQEEGLPIDSGNAAGGTMLNIFDLMETEPCLGSWINDEGETPNCNAVFRGLCFESDEAACTCAGCGDDSCLIAESFPTQVSCDTQGFVD